MGKYVKIEILYKVSQKIDIQILERKDLAGFPRENSVIKITIIKESDNIKDLCDAFYIDTNYCYADDFDSFYTDFNSVVSLEYMIDHTRKWLYKDLPTDDDVDKYLSQEVTYTLYGMVKTSRGFIFVAKMNDNNEFEVIV